MEKLDKQLCPFCHKSTLTVLEEEKKFSSNKAFLFSMSCSNCGCKESDIELETKKESKTELEIKSERDLKNKVISSSEAKIKIPELRMDLIKSGIFSAKEILLEFKKILEEERDSAEDKIARKKAKNLLKKLWKFECGDLKFRIQLEDKSGNSMFDR